MGISIPQLLIILVIVLLLFGTKKLAGLGSDLGGAIKGFKKAVGDEEKDAEKDMPSDYIEGDAKREAAPESQTQDSGAGTRQS